MDSHGNISRRVRFSNTREDIQSFAESLPPHSQLAFEASFSWYYFYEILEKYNFKIFLSHPLKTRLIAEARVKTDKIDSTILAHLLRAKLLPTSYIPPRHIRDLREFLRFRAFLVAMRTSLKNRIRNILAKQGIVLPYSDIFGKKSLKYLKNVNLSQPYKYEMDLLVKLGEVLLRTIENISLKIKEEAMNCNDALLLTSIPGIGYFSALLIVAEIGDINRFPSARKLTSFAGLVPSVRSSGGKSRYGPITKQGSKWLRWIMIELSPHFAKASPRMNKLFKRVSSTHGVHKARVAVAREMLKIIFYMLRDKRKFHPYP